MEIVLIFVDEKKRREEKRRVKCQDDLLKYTKCTYMYMYEGVGGLHQKSPTALVIALTLLSGECPVIRLYSLP